MKAGRQPPRTRLLQHLAGGLLALLLPAALPAAEPEGTATPVVSAQGREIYARARPSLLQIRTLVKAAGRQNSIGSGFIVSPDGLVITNYHVVSDHLFDPQAYTLEFLDTDGQQGTLEVVAFDVVNDLALVRRSGADLPHLELDPAAIAGNIARGDRLYALGNPHDIGFMITEGMWNGSVEKSFIPHIHFTGALNVGMSGGPVLSTSGHVAGVNVSHRLDSQLVSYLVPAEKVAALIARAAAPPPVDAQAARREVGRQLLAWQDDFYAALLREGFETKELGAYTAPESKAPWFNCWASTNSDETPAPLLQVERTNCRLGSSIFVSYEQNSGSLALMHSRAVSTELNAFRFASGLSKLQRQPSGGGTEETVSAPLCREAFVADPEGKRPTLLLSWCARAYRDFAGLYDVTLIAVTQDRSREALVSRLIMNGISYPNALRLGRRFTEAIGWTQPPGE